MLPHKGEGEAEDAQWDQGKSPFGCGMIWRWGLEPGFMGLWDMGKAQQSTTSTGNAVVASGQTSTARGSVSYMHCSCFPLRCRGSHPLISRSPELR